MPRRRIIDRLGRLWPKSGWLSTTLGKRVLLGVAVVVLAALPLAIRVVPLGFDEGEPAPRTFRAPRSIQFTDVEATEALRQAASDAVSPVYVFDEAARTQARQEIVQFFASVTSARASYSTDATAQAAFLSDRYRERLDDEAIAAVLALPDASLDIVARNVEGLVAGILSGRIEEEDLADAKDQLARSAQLIQLTITERYAVIAVGTAFLEPTYTEDEAATARARAEADERVSPVVMVVQEGENIIERGDIVTERDIELVRTLGGLEQGTDAVSVIAAVLVMTVLILSAGVYWAVYDQATWGLMRNLMLLATLLLGMMYLTRGMSILAPEVSTYLMPVALAAILATLLLGPRPAVVLTILTTVASLLLGFSGGAQVVVTLLGSLAAIGALAFVTQRSHLFYLGGFLIAFLGIVSFGASLASGNAPGDALVSGLYGLAGGLVTAVLMVGLLPFFEFVFGVTTDITLLELGNPSHPLLKRLMTEAPGTYSHSVMAANLAETAAEAIGANQLLARVGGYFHDAGKVVRPAFFVENQAGGENPHDSTSPSLSARIITAHVREGVELAEQYGLPSEVVDIIRQHHGTSVVGYFYDKASKKGGPLLEADFRYDGRRPDTPEAALVMIADMAEAGVRSLDKATPQRIEAMIRKMVRTKIDDHQLDETSLTLADVETIVMVYTRMLASVYHPRIEYPEPAEEGERHAGEHRQPQGA
ncbi:MAG: HDIG domain-containing protein [Coriobacteriia bacterium]|nr:HDIG domain-containing protein [Coriobacteriia bacterium]